MSIDPAALPRHVAIIMDGNGRWARERGMPRIEGHRRGANAVHEVVRAAREIGVKALTLYAFSAQNWFRPPEEVSMLMRLLREYVIAERAEIMDNAIRLITIGDADRLPGLVREPLDSLVRESADNKAMTLCLALSYGGRESIIATTRALCDMVKQGVLLPSDITEDRFRSTMQTADLPQLDLLIRTSGEVRLSNWPEFGRDEFVRALESYRGRERRFGLTGDQLRRLG
jgi:undecaprenyl diphosphate synthase